MASFTQPYTSVQVPFWSRVKSVWLFVVSPATGVPIVSTVAPEHESFDTPAPGQTVEPVEPPLLPFDPLLPLVWPVEPLVWPVEPLVWPVEPVDELFDAFVEPFWPVVPPGPPVELLLEEVPVVLVLPVVVVLVVSPVVPLELEDPLLPEQPAASASTPVRSAIRFMPIPWLRSRRPGGVLHLFRGMSQSLVEKILLAMKEKRRARRSSAPRGSAEQAVNQLAEPEPEPVTPVEPESLPELEPVGLTPVEPESLPALVVPVLPESVPLPVDELLEDDVVEPEPEVVVEPLEPLVDVVELLPEVELLMHWLLSLAFTSEPQSLPGPQAAQVAQETAVASWQSMSWTPQPQSQLPSPQSMGSQVQPVAGESTLALVRCRHAPPGTGVDV